MFISFIGKFNINYKEGFVSRLSFRLMLVISSLVIATVACSAPLVTGVQPTVINAAPQMATVPATILAPTQAAATQPVASKVAAKPTASQPAATQPAASMPSDEVIKTVQSAWAAMDKAGPRHVSQTSYQGKTAIINIEADSVPPNLHQIVSVNGQVMAEQYIFDGTFYNKLSGQWSQLKGPANQATNMLAGMAEGLKDQIILSDGKVLGIENVNDKPATGYSYSSALKGLAAAPITHNVWVDAASGWVVKQEILKSDGEDTVQIITYNASLMITLPPEVASAPTAK